MKTWLKKSLIALGLFLSFFLFDTILGIFIPSSFTFFLWVIHFILSTVYVLYSYNRTILIIMISLPIIFHIILLFGGQDCEFVEPKIHVERYDCKCFGVRSYARGLLSGSSQCVGVRFQCYQYDYTTSPLRADFDSIEQKKSKKEISCEELDKYFEEKRNR